MRTIDRPINAVTVDFPIAMEGIVQAILQMEDEQESDQNQDNNGDG